MKISQVVVLLSSVLSVAADVASDIEEATDEIWDIIREDNTLGPKFVRLGFHDCVGGCDGCVNMDNGDNAGLDVAIDALTSVVNTYESDTGLSRADIWALSAITATNFGLDRDGGSSTYFEMSYYGRENCAENDPTGGFDHELPPPDLDTDGVLDFFADNFEFSDQETCAIMGAHTLGTLSQANSGFVADGWVRSNHLLNNRYYEGIVGEGTTEDEWFEAPGWTLVEIENEDPMPNRFQWERGNGDDNDESSCSGGILSAIFGGNCDEDDDDTTTIMLNADIALVRTFGDNLSEDGDVSCDFRGRDACPAADTLEQMAAYRMDNDLW
eukprot:CAMPEP_0178939192 /NCGR_PEP_ID=MMETSP0789-20121207/67_1 /TAXON_ID=3005 /ORGANISM="Rhizosolenia setigera, Strain CCMP 1694" /LENGTH=326 /DNA_ID=CAMNT_0020617993 /DNA_START=1075 /DNA_END=2052 /DNA_ORIENTATION=-